MSCEMYSQENPWPRPWEVLEKWAAQSAHGAKGFRNGTVPFSFHPSASSGGNTDPFLHSSLALVPFLWSLNICVRVWGSSHVSGRHLLLAGTALGAKKRE